MKIKFRIDDGYVGRDRPHYVKVDDEDIAACETLDEAEELVEQEISAYMRHRLYTFWDRSQIDELVGTADAA